MILVAKIYKNVSPSVVEVFQNSDPQSLIDAKALAQIYHRKDGGTYGVFVSVAKEDDDESDVLDGIND